MTQLSPSVLREARLAAAIMKDALQLDSLRQAGRAMNDFALRQRELYDAIVRPSELLRGILENIRREDAEFRELADRARNLGAFGWTLPLWASPQVVKSFLVDDDPVAVSRELVGYFKESRGRHAKDLVRSVCDANALKHWRRLLRQAAGAFNRRQYSIVVPALFAVLEGRIAHATGSLGTRKPASKNAAVGRESSRSGISVAAWASVQGFVDSTFRDHAFSEKAPTMLNRHWALHGRAEPLWTRVDALMLWQAISTISTLEP